MLSYWNTLQTASSLPGSRPRHYAVTGNTPSHSHSSGTAGVTLTSPLPIFLSGSPGPIDIRPKSMVLDYWASIYSYTAKQGRTLANPRLTLSRSIGDKWSEVLTSDFLPDWRAVWHSSRPRKDAVFMWSIYHKAVVVNHWRHRAFPGVSAECPCCDRGEPESILHCFYSCEYAACAWAYGNTVLHILAGTPLQSMPWTLFTWEQCIMGTPIPAQFQAFAGTWSLIRGVILWTIWVQRNQWVFNNNRWPMHILEQSIWDAPIDLARSL